jgi:sugar phosphate isomerase/epimerase
MSIRQAFVVISLGLKKPIVLDRIVYTHLDNFRRLPTGRMQRGVQPVDNVWWDRSVTLSDGFVDIATLVRGLKQHGYRNFLEQGAFL